MSAGNTYLVLLQTLPHLGKEFLAHRIRKSAVLAWDRNSVSYPGVLTQANYINSLQYFGGVVQEKRIQYGVLLKMGVSNPRDDRAERNLGVASVPLSTVIPRVGNAYLQQNPIRFLKSLCIVMWDFSLSHCFLTLGLLFVSICRS